ncbi:MAG: endonuclease [Gammaproteobacteria bacterium]|nr:endonuclease [Gammaproteobacteria bacterium]
MKSFYACICLFLLMGCSSHQEPPLPHAIGSFQEAKKLAEGIYADRRTTFYCGCDFDAKKNVSAEKCGYKAAKDPRRGQHVEWEHVVPAYDFGHTRQCWKNPREFSQCQKNNGKWLNGRNCCSKVDPMFNAMVSDLYNLVPAVGELNSERGNFPFGIIEGEERRYGACDFEVNSRAKITEPAPALRGDIARTYFYFEKTYGLPINNQQRQLFNEWNSADPVSDWERERAKRIQRIQGNPQPFISESKPH